MENRDQDNSKNAESKKVDWHSIAKTGILFGKILIVIFLLHLVVITTLNTTRFPYNIPFIGIEISLAILSVFSIVRMGTFKPRQNYDFESFKSKKDQIQLLLINISHDIDKYEEGSSYYFNGVRFYKYSTMILAGLSTIILGLDLSDYPEWKIFDKMTYTKFAKNVALIIGAIITVTTALMSYWNIEKYWLTNKTIVNKLKSLREDIENEFVKGVLQSNPQILEEKVNKYKEIKGDFYKYWEGALADRGSQTEQGEIKRTS